MNVLVTGGCGFIGKNLVSYLTSKGYQVRILDDLSVGNQGNMTEIENQDHQPVVVDLIIGDIREQDVVSRVVEGTDAVVHLAAYTGVTDSLQNPAEHWDVNVNGTINLLEACRQHEVGRFIFASSNAAVGEQTPPIDETKTPRPLSPYGASKLAGEALCSAYYQSYGLKTVALRFANCYGLYSDHKGSVITRFIKWIREGQPLIIYGDGDQTRDFVHVEDVCQAIYLSLITNDRAFGEVFQIASGAETSINELVDTIKEVTHKELEIHYQPERKGEIRRNFSNIAKATAVLGFQTKVGLKEGLQRLWNGTLA